MNKTLEGMVRAYEDGFLSSTGSAHTRADAMKAVLNWLADNVSDEMVAAALRTTPENLRAYKDSPALSLMIDAQRHDISAALRAAAGGK